MEFRPCIDIHNGKVKQIVGGSLLDENNSVVENFVSKQDAKFYANLYKKAGLKGGHIILLNPVDSKYYQNTKEQAIEALKEYPEGLQIGGGITCDNALAYLEAGASQVIVTSYVFHDGIIDLKRLEKLTKLVGKDKLVLDLSCKKIGDDYFVVTNRWQNITDHVLDLNLLEEMEKYCCEFLIHAVDVEGKSNGIEEELIKRIASWEKTPITYAGGVHNYQDLELLKKLGENRMNVTIGSALDLFGGTMKWERVLEIIQEK